MKARCVKLLKSFLPQNVFNIAVLNIIWAMVAAKRYDYDDPLIKELLMMVTDVTASLAPTPSLGFLGRHHHFPQTATDEHLHATLWGVHSIVIFCKVFLTCFTGRWDDTAATVHPYW